MKKIFVTLLLFILMLSHNKVSFASDDIIVDYIDPELSIEVIEDSLIDSFFKNLNFQNFMELIVHYSSGTYPAAVIHLLSTLPILLFILIIILKIITVD